jgi:hypothetical protein
MSTNRHACSHLDDSRSTVHLLAFMPRFEFEIYAQSLGEKESASIYAKSGLEKHMLTLHSFQE